MKTVWSFVLLLLFVAVVSSLVNTSKEIPQETIYITITQIVEVEVPVIVEKEKALVFFSDQSREQEVYTPIPQPTMTEAEIRSGSWTDLPFDQNGDGTVSCLDFKGDKSGLDNLLDLAYNRYNMNWLDSDSNNIPCDE